MSEEVQKKDKLFTPQFIAVVIAFICTQFAQSMIQTTFTVRIKDLGAAAALVGSIGSIFALVGMFMRIIFGPLMKSRSRKTLAIISGFVQIVAYVLYAFSNTPGMAAAVRVLQGVGHSMSSGVFLALGAEVVPRSRMTEGIGVFTAIPLIFTAWANPLMLLLADKSWSTAYLVAAALMGLATVLTFFIKYEDPYKGQKPPKIEFKLENIVGKGALIPIILMILGKGSTQGYGFYQIYARGINPDLSASIGLVGTVILYVTVISRPFISKLADKIGSVKTILICHVLAAASLWIYSSSTTLAGFMFGGVLAGLSTQHVEVLIKAMFVKYMPDDFRAVAANSSMFANDIASFLTPNITGWMVQALGNDTAAYGVGHRYWCIAIAISAVVFLAFRRNVEEHENAYSTEMAAASDKAE